MNAPPGLLEVLERARSAGFLGPGPVEPHLRHAEGFATAARDALGREPANFADLGTGGGVPGLVLALQWERCSAILVEVGQRRAEFLRTALVDLSLGDRVAVVEERGEAVARSLEFRERFDLVTARSFAAPAVTAEIASGLARVSGIVLVSEPPTSDRERWPVTGLHELGYGGADPVEVDAAHFAVLRKERASSDRYPRPVGRPAKRPLW